MGAEFFHEYVGFEEVPDNVKSSVACFEHRKDELIQRYGTDPYSGTMKEKESFEMAMEESLTPHEADEWVDGWLDRDDRPFDDKWGPAGCIRVCHSINKRHTTTGYMFFGWASS